MGWKKIALSDPTFFFLKELEGSLSCTSSPLDPMREGEHWVPACPPACLPAALNCTHGARYSSQECVFLQMIKSIQFWQDLLEHASLFYAIPSPSSGAFITLPACQLMEIVLSPHLIEGRGYDARCPQFSSDAEVCACVCVCVRGGGAKISARGGSGVTLRLATEVKLLLLIIVVTVFE